jgi:hypothetical protein
MYKKRAGSTVKVAIVGSTFFWALVGLTLPAAANTLPLATFSLNLNLTTAPAVGLSGHTPVADSISVGGATATASTGSGPPSATAGASVTSSYQQADAVVDVLYYFQVSGPLDYTGNVFMPLNIAASGGVTASTPDYFLNRAEVILDTPNPASGPAVPTVIGSACIPTASQVCGSLSTSSSFSINHAVSVAPNTTNSLELQLFIAAVSLSASSASASGFIDPVITFGPGVDTSLYSIQFSDGISNGIAATPIPAAMPLFVSGLGGLGLLGWRRRKKVTAQA